MCTVSWIHDSDGYEVLCNRDEKLTRQPALPPQIRERDGIRYLAPVDRMAPRDASAIDGEARQFLTRHQFESRVMMPSRERAQRRPQTYKVAERAGKDHQHALRLRDPLRRRRYHRR